MSKIEVNITMLAIEVKSGNVAFVIREGSWRHASNHHNADPQRVAECLGMSIDYLAGLYSGLMEAQKFRQKIRLAEMALEDQVHKARLVAKTVESASMPDVMRKHQITCKEFAMPDVPPPYHTAAEITRMPPFSGLYFAWDGLICVYVGKSINVPRRMSNHDTIAKECQVSFIVLPKDLIGRAELFYIWLLNPPKNRNIQP